MSSTTYNPKYFTVTFPQQYVAHVEINRADKMNAFIEEYSLPTPISLTLQTN
jgi:delta(3,5)-delta(2,4)-dienoyl-CoA isomerase